MWVGKRTLITLLSIIFLIGFAGLQMVDTQPWFCNTCHEMNFNYKSWQSSTHGPKAVCLDCHSEPGLRGLVDNNIRGAEQFVAHISGNYEIPIQIKNLVKNDQCLACHPEIRDLTDNTIDAKHSLHMDKNVLCVDCHNHLVHNHSGQPRVMTLDQCDTCHKKHTNFELLGKHTAVNCEKCHQGDNYTGTDRNCEFCHKVPANHSVEIANDCDMCHNLTGWKPANFDHSKFPLIEKHQSLKCDQCHVDGIYKGIAAACVDCHEPPLSHAGMDIDCVQCHNIRGFKPANFKHKYVGEHVGRGAEHSLSCIRCHPESFKEATCIGCHASNNLEND
jgi:nitrate/TMAO reductase-like tetraheme cytochrome c subunit